MVRPAGGSTVAFAQLVKKLYVAEHAPSWAAEASPHFSDPRFNKGTGMQFKDAEMSLHQKDLQGWNSDSKSSRKFSGQPARMITID